MSKFRTVLNFLLRYGFALLTIAAAVLLRHALTPLIGDTAAPFATITAAVMLSAWLVGTGPATLAAIVGLVAADIYFLESTYSSQRSANVIHILTYLVVIGSALLMSAAYRRSLSKYRLELRRREEIERELLREQEALREAEEKFRAVAEISSSAIVIHDGVRLRYMNRASEDLFGYTREELLIGDMWQIAHPEYRQMLKDRSIARLRGEQVPNRYEYKIITKSGEERWLYAGAKTISFEGQLCVLVNAFDVTDRKCAEEALQNREEHYRAAIEAGKVGTWEWDITRNWINFSENWYPLTSTLDRNYRFTSDEKAGPYLTFEQWRGSIHKDDVLKVDAAIRSALEGDSKYEVEFRVPQKAATGFRWLAASGRVMRDDAGNPVRMVGAALDITERRGAEEALRNSEKLAATGRLAASIAHEINNPLEAVTNLIFLARSATADNPQSESLLGMAEEELKRAAHLTKQTLGFYRDSTSPTRFNVARVIDDVLSLYARRIESRRIRVRKRYVEPVEMEGMVGEIRQAVSNLIANAIDAMPASGGTLHLRVRPTSHAQSGPAVQIVVADTGTGIALELRNRIFEPFFTTKQETGTGLGLWLTKNIVENHGGTIRFSSGRTGTVFLMSVPQHYELAMSMPASA